MIARKYYKIYLKNIISFYFADKNSNDYLAKFENIVKSKTTFENAIALKNGRSAIILALRDIQKKSHSRNEIITSAYNLGELIPLLESENFKVKLIDVNESTWMPTLSSIKEAITEHTCAVLIPQIYGNSAQNKEIAEYISSSHPEIKFVNDCAHVFGTSHVNYGDYSILSFQHNKPLSCGGGGMLLTNQEIDRAQLVETSNIEDLKNLIKQFIEKLLINTFLYRFVRPILFSRTLSQTIQALYRRTNNSPSIQSIGKLSQLKSFIGLCALKTYDSEQEQLRENFNTLTKLLSEKYILQERALDNNFYNAVILSEHDPEEMRNILAKKGLDIGIGNEVMDNCFNTNDNISSELAHKNILLPIHLKTSKEDIIKIADILNKLGEES